MIAFLDDEPGAAVVEQVLTEPGSTCYAHIFNLMEVYYIYFRRGGAVMAEDALQSLIDAGIVVRDDHDAAFWKEAATFKGTHAIALPILFVWHLPTALVAPSSPQTTMSSTLLSCSTTVRSCSFDRPLLIDSHGEANF